MLRVAPTVCAVALANCDSSHRAGRRYNLARMKTLTVFMANAAATLSVLGALWTLASTMSLWPHLETAWYSDRYQPDTLVVEAIARESFNRKGGSSSYSCHAEGPVGPTRERLTLSVCTVGADGQVITKEATKGERIPVLINRTISPNGPSAGQRAVRFRADLEATAWSRVRSILPLAYGPLLFPATVALLLGIVARVAFKARAGFWCLWPVLAVLIVQAVGLAIALR